MSRGRSLCCATARRQDPRIAERGQERIRVIVFLITQPLLLGSEGENIGEHLLLDLPGAVGEGESFVRLAELKFQPRQSGQATRDAGMDWAEIVRVNAQRPPNVCLRLSEVPQVLINVRKILKAIGDIGVVVSEYGFADPEGTFHQWSGFDEFPPIRVKHAQVLQTLGGGHVVGPESVFPEPKRALKKWLGLVIPRGFWYSPAKLFKVSATAAESTG